MSGDTGPDDTMAGSGKFRNPLHSSRRVTAGLRERQQCLSDERGRKRTTEHGIRKERTGTDPDRISEDFLKKFKHTI